MVNEKNIDIKEKRYRLNYLVYQLGYFNDFRCQMKSLWILIVPLLVCETMLLITDNERIKSVVVSLAIPLAVGVILKYFGNKTEGYKMALEYESELFDICNYINTHDELRSNERYILNYVCTSKEKYIKSNKFCIENALGTFE